MLYVCATPLGNLEDITLRTLRVFRKVDYILCEDTRRTIKLLNHYEIKKRLVSMNEHTEFHKKNFVIEDLKEGKSIALVSDAGMPGIQDPGQMLIREVIKNKLEYTVLPGPSAMITAIVGSGWCEDEFLFLGFLPRKKKERQALLMKHRSIEAELILYEAPHRFPNLLEDALEILGDREIIICRELSKKFEEYIHTTLSEALNERSEIQGELVIIIKRSQGAEEWTENELLFLVNDLASSLSSKEVAKELMKRTGISKNRAYELSLRVKKEKDDK